MGIVKDKLEIRWSEPYWEEKDSGWKEYIRLELSALRSHDPGLLRSFFQPVKIIRLDQLGDEAALDYDPYHASPTFGLHRLRLPVE